MLIEKLIVRKTKPNEEIIRDISFNLKGLSLIVDNTTDEANESGNSVGKTTVVQIIDLCLSAKSPRELYYDSDTKSKNDDVEIFLNDNKVQAELILTDSKKESKYSIKRDLFFNGKRYIDGKPMAKNSFEAELKKILFATNEIRPKLRQLIPKFVRLSGTSEESMIKYLHQTTKTADYDAIYCMLFQIYDKELISEKSKLVSQLRECQKAIKILESSKSIGSLSVLNQSMELIESDLTKYYTKRKSLSYIEEYKDELNKKRKISTSINEYQLEIQLIEFEISTIENSIEKLAQEKNNIDLSVLKEIYLEAQVYLPKLQKKFEEVLSFHNAMIQNKIDFIQEQILSKRNRLENFVERTDNLIREKEKITFEVLDEGLLDELNLINNDIEKLAQKKGEIVKSIALLEEQNEIKSNLNKELECVESKMDNKDVEKKIKKFNEIFSEYCEKLYGEKYFLAYNEKWKDESKFPIEIASLGGNLGTGKKKAVIVAIDLAYMKYSIIMNIQAPQFVIHDKMENTHINQLKTIFEISKNIDGQYIMPILRERIDKIDKNYIEKAKVLELSEDNKFFKV